MARNRQDIVHIDFRSRCTLPVIFAPSGQFTRKFRHFGVPNVIRSAFIRRLIGLRAVINRRPLPRHNNLLIDHGRLLLLINGLLVLLRILLLSPCKSSSQDSLQYSAVHCSSFVLAFLYFIADCKFIVYNLPNCNLQAIVWYVPVESSSQSVSLLSRTPLLWRSCYCGR